jgi:hypothetical protein
VARYRLRFLLQEFDLPRGTTVIGRSLDCNLTIEDPLVSRQHASIALDDDGGSVQDMGSRNGVKVNGLQIRTPTPLRDGDRVRIGTQDFVFCRVESAAKAHTRTTGVLRLCAKCRLPYPREIGSCPNCEATEQTDEDTLSGTFGSENQTAWSVQLLVEALERALTLGRLSDAERLARRATAQVEELVAAGAALDTKGLAALARQAVATTLATHDPTWILWVLDIYRRTDRVPPVHVVETVGEAAGPYRGVVHGALVSLLAHVDVPGGRPSLDDMASITLLNQIRSVLEPPPGELDGARGVGHGDDVGPVGDVGGVRDVGDVGSGSEETVEWPRPAS